jgi:hypothetical protein
LVARPNDTLALRKSERPEPRQPGDDAPRTALTDRVHVQLVSRNSHISGLI